MILYIILFLIILAIIIWGGVTRWKFIIYPSFETFSTEAVHINTLSPENLVKYVRDQIIPNSEIKYNKKMFDSPWDKYQLADIIKSKEYRKESINNIKKYDWYPKSIAAQYLQKTDEENNWNVLKSIIKKYKKDQNIIAIHLRIGDVIDNDSKHSIVDLLSKPCKYINGYQYVLPLSHYKKKLKKMKETGIKKIIIFAGSRPSMSGKSLYKSYEYIMAIKTFLEKNGFEVKLRLRKNPDDDLIYASNSKYFLPSGGGYSKLISMLVKMYGGKIL